jgi:hypothetical protein
MAAAPRRAPPPRGFQPRFTLMVLYFCAFVFVYCLAMVSPALFEIARSPASGPEQQKLAEVAAHQGLQGRLWIAVAAAGATMALGIWTRVLPGLRSPR